MLIPVEKDSMREYLKAVSEKLDVSENSISIIKILSKSIDINNKEQFYYELSIAVCISCDFDNRSGYSQFSEPARPDNKLKNIKSRPIVVGFGPAGMFAALELIARGAKPLIFERGKRIEDRDVDVQRFIKERKLNSESNIQFGEGGAGAYSDGKLFSRKNNSEHIKKVLDSFIKFGAPEEISYISKPHLGTDVLCEIVRNIRKHILKNGGEIFYSSKMTDIIVFDGEAAGIVINDEKEYYSSDIYLGVGNSARDTFKLVRDKNIIIEQKPIAVGVRIEHPVELINLIRYGSKYKDFGAIGAANYSFNYTDRALGRGAYTFCMCPGGEIINASSQEGMLVVNGMSYSSRASEFSNSAIVVNCNSDDYVSKDPLAGVYFQEDIEKKAFNAAGANWSAPGQNLMDFMSGRISKGLNRNSYKMGDLSIDLNEVLPGFICKVLKSAFTKWREDSPLFVSEHAVLLGAETRTSSPVLIKRNEAYESVSLKNLYPIGEGSGYSGGIMSSATDAIRAVEASMNAL